MNRTEASTRQKGSAISRYPVTIADPFHALWGKVELPRFRSSDVETRPTKRWRPKNGLSTRTAGNGSWDHLLVCHSQSRDDP